MKPTYEIENFQFFNADNMLVMSQYPDKFFELAIIDPPYGIGEDGLKNHSRGNIAKPTLYTPKEWDKKPVDKTTLDEIIRISQNQIFWGANHFISKIPYNSSAWIVWDKQNGQNDFADCELAWTSFDSAVRIFKFRWAGMLQGNMKNKQIRIHPTEKPIALYEWILNKYAKPNDKIIDTHLGSGSITIAIDKANTLDKKNLTFVGIELDTDYFNASIERFKNHKRQCVLF
jgi:site-specific DNA-methyltransferase (adenine-specific)